MISDEGLYFFMAFLGCVFAYCVITLFLEVVVSLFYSLCNSYNRYRWRQEKRWRSKMRDKL
jgi:hypothetical protein